MEGVLAHFPVLMVHLLRQYYILCIDKLFMASLLEAHAVRVLILFILCLRKM
jgi:hypothetical protein